MAAIGASKPAAIPAAIPTVVKKRLKHIRMHKKIWIIDKMSTGMAQQG